MNDQDFNTFIEKYQKGLLYGEEKMLVDEWFDDMRMEIPEGGWTEADERNLKRQIFLKIRANKKTGFMNGFPSIFGIVIALIPLACTTVDSGNKMHPI